jgi:hypothetical protein
LCPKVLYEYAVAIGYSNFGNCWDGVKPS